MNASRLTLNPHQGATPVDTSVFDDPRAQAFHEALPGYEPTALKSLPALARELEVRAVLVKDESHRFGLPAFKVLGAAYAMFRFIQGERLAAGLPEQSPEAFLHVGSGASRTFATATDGNHGRAVAWVARQLGQRAVIFVPGNTVPARIDALRSEGAEVVVIEGTYDDTVRAADARASAEGWQIISDTAYPGYMEIPQWIMAGYGTLFREADAQVRAAVAQGPSAVFLQAGVGGMAAAGEAFYLRPSKPQRPAMICVEPLEADCLRASADTPDGEPLCDVGPQDSIMAGLNCGTPSLLAWPLLKHATDAFLAVGDEASREAMRRFDQPLENDPRVESGESGAAGLAGLLALCREPALQPARERLRLGPDAVVLLINTEGATDPVSFAAITAEPPLTHGTVA
ncbi:MAG: diaminopropionate ammonia-lyase [Opitutales bacterium]